MRDDGYPCEEIRHAYIEFVKNGRAGRLLRLTVICECKEQVSAERWFRPKELATEAGIYKLLSIAVQPKLERHFELSTVRPPSEGF